MKITRSLVKDFEKDQKEYGTEVAIYNLLWRQADEQMTDLGVTRVRTET